MLRTSPPSDQELAGFLAGVSGSPLSYRPVGLTEPGPRRRGWVRDHNRVVLGAGEAAWVAARTALAEWAWFDQAWLRLFPAEAPIEVGTEVVIAAGVGPLWSLNACRIVAVHDEAALSRRRYGFAYGTLPSHAERGEELFQVTMDDVTGEVGLEILAYSRPNLWYSQLGFPVVRTMQRRFAAGAVVTMQRRVAALLAAAPNAT